MTSPAGLFCAHKRLRTACPECRPPPPPPPKAKPAKEPRAKDPSADADDDAPSGKRGPGKPLLPTRARRAKPPTREEAEKAEAWWVKDK